jgi:hypothetical protein
MKCWICGDEASSGEHRTKKSDMRAIFGHIRQAQSLYWNAVSQRNQRVKGLDARVLKFNDTLCSRCNNERTQPYDRAWEALSAYLRSKPKIRGGERIDLGKVFPGAVHRSMLHVHLFFVKLFGCSIVESSIPIDIGGFSAAILKNTAHPKVHLAVSPYTDGIAFGSAGYSDLDTAQLNGHIVYATWQYILDRFSIRVMYAEPTEHRKGLIDSWHPSAMKKCLRVSNF